MASGEEKVMVHFAVARRDVGVLEVMETMCAVPEGVTWVSLGSSSLRYLFEVVKSRECW